MSDEGTHDPYQALRYPEYRWFLTGAMALTMATQVQTLVMGWQVYQITHDPLSLGLIGLAEALPFLGLSLFGGWAADRQDRRRLTLAGLAVMFLGALLLLALNSGGSPRAAWPFYAIQALSGLGRAFYRPAFQALGSELVPREAYQNAATWRGSTFQMALVTGPALGGLIFGFGSARSAYGTEVLLMAFAVAALLQVAPRPRKPSGAPILQSLGQGVAFVFTHRLVLSALSLDLFAILFGGAVALLPVFAADILHAGPQGLGLLRTAPALGSMAMGLWLAHHPPTRRAGTILLLCVAGFGLCWISFALSRGFWLSMALLAASGAMDNVSVVLRGTLVQILTPMEMMGRVQAVNGFFIGSSNELGGFESGLAARLLGVVPSVVFGGLVTLGVVGFTGWRVPELRRMKRIAG
jgi:MFS family permease